MINYVELVQNVEDGIENPFKAKAILEELKKDIEECLNQIKPIVIEEASKYEEAFELDGLKIEKRKGRKTFDYSSIPQWVESKNKTKEIEREAKEVYSLYEKGKKTFDEVTGEVLPIPNVKYSDDVVVVKNLGESLLR